MKPRLLHFTYVWIYCSVFLAALCLPVAAVVLNAQGDSGPVHGLWVWKSPEVLSAPGGAESLLDNQTATFPLSSLPAELLAPPRDVWIGGYLTDSYLFVNAQTLAFNPPRVSIERPRLRVDGLPPQ